MKGTTEEVIIVHEDTVAELRERGWRYVWALGYQPYEKTSNTMNVEWRKVKNRYYLRITCHFEENFTPHSLSFDVPSVHFDSLISISGSNG